MKSLWMAGLVVPMVWPFGAGPSVASSSPASTSSALTSSAPTSSALTSWSQGRLTRVVPPPPVSEQDRKVWRERLTDADLDARERNFDAVVQAASTDEAVRTMLEEWSRDTSELELSWTARLALRDSRNAVRFHDPRMRGFGLSPDWDPFQDSQRLFDELLRGIDPRMQQPALPQGQGGTSTSESFSLESGPDGVKCTVTREVDGREVTEEYSAKTIDELLEAHPELRSKIRGTSVSPFGALPRGFQFHLGTPRQSMPLTGLHATGQVRTDVLGVVVEPLSADDALKLGLDAGVGLRIERVEPGTIAHQLGLQRGHVLFEINGTAIHSRDDISDVIRKRGADGALDVVVVDRWGQKRTRTWKPDSEKQI